MTADAWEAWREVNRRITNDGGSLELVTMDDGSMEYWAELNGERWRVDPPQGLGGAP